MERLLLKYFSGALLLFCSATANAEVWACKRDGSQAAMYTETPTNEPGVTCTPVESITFSKSENNSNARANKGNQNSRVKTVKLRPERGQKKNPGASAKKKRADIRKLGMIGDMGGKKKGKKKKKKK